MNYSTLISKFASNEALFQSVMSDIKEDASYLNLTTADWETQLKNNVCYQDFLNNAKHLWKPPFKNDVCCYEESKIPNFNVIVMGYCKFVKPYKGKLSKQGIYVSNCDPLNKICQAMTSDLDPSIQLSNEFKFNFVECSRLTCHLCNDGAEMFSEYGYNMDCVNQPCISDTKIFDGKRVVNRFSSQMQKMLCQPFLAVMFLQIKCRYSYITHNKIEIHRIAGDILNIIGFNESKLTLNKKFDIGPLVKFATPEKQQEPDIFSELMSEDDKQPEKRSNDGAIEEEPKNKILKVDNSKNDDFAILSEIMEGDSFDNAQNLNTIISGDESTQELASFENAQNLNTIISDEEATQELALI